MTEQFPPSLRRFGAAFETAVRDEVAATRARADREAPRRAGALRRPRILAGGTLGLAGVAAAATIAFSGAASPPALAVTRQADGSVLVKVNTDQRSQPWVQAADRKLASMGIHEQIAIAMARGPATTPGTVKCTGAKGPPYLVPSSHGYVPGPDAGTPSGPPIKVLLGTDGTDTIPSGTTGAGTVHLTECMYYDTSALGNSGSGATRG